MMGDLRWVNEWELVHIDPGWMVWCRIPYLDTWVLVAPLGDGRIGFGDTGHDGL